MNKIPDYKCNENLRVSALETALNSKIVEGSDTTFREIMPQLRTIIGMGMFSTLDDSKEDLLQAEIKKKDDQLKELQEKLEKLDHKSE